MALRCFIAVDLPEDIKLAVSSVVETLRTTGADVKWTAAQNLHITLKFLGNTEETMVGTIRDTLEKKIAPYTPFYIKISGIGTFPGGRHPRVIWMDIQDQGRLVELQQAVEESVSKLGIAPEERAYSPHLTIGRVRSPRKMPELQKRLGQFTDKQYGEFPVSGLRLMKSDLKPGGPEYTSLAEIILEGRGNEQQG